MELKLTQRLASRGFDPRGRVPDLDAQVAWFRAKFPEGFSDLAWRRDARGERPAGRAPVGLTRAMRSLPALLAARGATGDDATHEAMAAALRAARIPLLRGLDELPRATTLAATSSAWLDALEGLLSADEASLAARFDAWCATHATPSWPVVTTLPALCAPSARMFVRPTLVDAQATALGVPIARTVKPSGEAFAAIVRMSAKLTQELHARALSPTDLLDVSLFSARALPGAQKP